MDSMMNSNGKNLYALDNLGVDDDDTRQRRTTGDDRAGAPDDVEDDGPIQFGSQSVALKRRLGLISGIGLIVGTMIGSGIFVSPKSVLSHTQSIGFSLVVWSGCGILSLLGSLCYVELGLTIPKSGGEYPYLLEGYGPLHRFLGPIPAFLFSWTTIVVLKSSALAIICLTFAFYTVTPFFVDCEEEDLPIIPIKLVTAIAILFVTFINCFSVKLASSLQNVLMFAKLLALGIVIVSGLVNIGQGKTSVLATGFSNTQTSPSAVGLAFYAGLWAFDGWNNLNFAIEEVKNPSRNLPLAILIGIPLVTILYILTIVAYHTVLTVDELLHSPAVAVTYGDIIFGEYRQYVSFIIPLSVALSTLGSANGTCFATGRLSYVAAREGHLIDVLSYVHVKRFTPTPALMFNALLAILMVIPSNIEALIDFFSFAAWLFYGLTVFALIILRFTNTGRNLKRAFKVPLPIPIAVFIISVYLVVAPILEDPAVEYLYATIFILSGLLFYVPFVYFRLHDTHLKFCKRFVDSLTVCLQMSLNICPPGEVAE